MVDTGYNVLGAVAREKIDFYKKNKAAYFISAILAGFYIGICISAILVIAGMLNDFAGLKILQSVSFAAALSIIVFADAELFTGNIFIITAGIMLKTIKPGEAAGISIFCYAGNLAGSVLTALLFWGTGYLENGVLTAAADAIDLKTAPLFGELLVRGILCNILVCVAVWCSFRIKRESGKLIIIFWAVYLFMVCGFEHSIANITLFSLGTIANIHSVGLMLINLAATTMGNILGGVMLSLAYWTISRK